MVAVAVVVESPDEVVEAEEFGIPGAEVASELVVEVKSPRSKALLFPLPF